MKTVIKLSIVTAIFGLIFSCSAPEMEDTPAASIETAYSKKSKSDLVEKTETYFKTIEDKVVSEGDKAYGEALTEELVSEWGKVLREEGGLEEAQDALRTLEEAYKGANASRIGSPCLDAFTSCAIRTIVRLVVNIGEGADQNTEMINAVVGIVGCLGDYLECTQ